MPVTFDDFASECVHYNVNICRGKRIIFIRKWIDCGIISVGQLFGPDGYLTYNKFKAKFHNVNSDYLLYEGVLSAIKCYQKKLGIEWKNDFAVDNAPVWKCLLKGGVNGIYARLVKIVTDPNVSISGEKNSMQR